MSAYSASHRSETSAPYYGGNPNVQDAPADRDLHHAIMQRLVTINQEFCANRESIYEDKVKEINQDIRDVCAGNHPIYLDKVKRLSAIRDEAIHKAKLHYEYQLDSAYQQYSEDMRKAEEEYTSEKEELREKLRANIEDRLKRLNEDKDILDITQDFNLDGSSRGNTKRNLRKRGADQAEPAKPSKRKHAATTALNCRLPEDEATDDLALMKKNICRHEASVEFLGEPNSSATVASGSACSVLVEFKPLGPTEGSG
ncbi:hypothetical protein H4R34_003749 [Dimargaris verticillata]|uniref:Sds3-like-domain-containing protein n=1 Tax=Dimargaris verticillata TaxID=2761393 RepID=A0A9W8AZF5_9FUNG|nr:hypothetical protein H4R34_003749 [Dimargaris verticillata]